MRLLVVKNNCKDRLLIERALAVDQVGYNQAFVVCIEVVMDKRFEDIEVRMAYLEATVEQLNQVVIKQQDQVDALTEAVKRQKNQLEQGGDLVRSLSEETPPPHY